MAMFAASSTAKASSQSTTPLATPATFTWPDPVGIEDGLEVRDWRLFPIDDHLRFMAEIHNTSDELLPSPIVGVISSLSGHSEGFSWGVPIDPVVYPQSSTFVMGVAPEGIQSDADWGTPEWLLCEYPPGSTNKIEKVQSWDIDLTSSYSAEGAEWLQGQMTATNNADTTERDVLVSGIVRDGNQRICGAMAISRIPLFTPGETREMVVNARPDLQMAANPFHLVSDATECSITFTLQPPGEFINSGCPAVMPWNQDD